MGRMEVGRQIRMRNEIHRQKIATLPTASKLAGQQVKINKSNNFDIEKNGGNGDLNSSALILLWRQ